MILTIVGLDLLLDGGLHLVRKLNDDRESTVVLIRGGAGSGKTIFGSHLALAEAASRNGDVVYCCIELLPSELSAQLGGIQFGMEGNRGHVTVLHSGCETGVQQHPTVFASIVDIPDNEDPDLGSELSETLEAARAIGLNPRVLVVDSLAEGYDLGANAPRRLADAFSKFAAEHGLILILIEEIMGPIDSLWTFVADVIFELSHHGPSGTPAGERRSMMVRKSRFGPSHVGPHGFTIRSEGGVEIYPRVTNYSSAWARKYLPRGISAGSIRWNTQSSEKGVTLPFDDEVILVTGAEPMSVARSAKTMCLGISVLNVDMARSGFPEDRLLLTCGNPLLSMEFLVSIFCRRLHELKGRISGLIIGDLDSIRNHLDPSAVRRVLPVLISIAHDAGLSILLYETKLADVQPTSIHLADTVLEITYPARGSVIARSRIQSNRIINITIPVE
jgi:KaiC/GvpD/RAD55 family RecA-like ATPase